MSRRRSPDSYLLTNDCGFFSRLATSSWRMPASSLTIVVSALNLLAGCRDSSSTNRADNRRDDHLRKHLLLQSAVINELTLLLQKVLPSRCCNFSSSKVLLNSKGSNTRGTINSTTSSSKLRSRPGPVKLVAEMGHIDMLMQVVSSSCNHAHIARDWVGTGSRSGHANTKKPGKLSWEHRICIVM